MTSVCEPSWKIIGDILLSPLDLSKTHPNYYKFHRPTWCIGIAPIFTETEELLKRKGPLENIYSGTVAKS